MAKACFRERSVWQNSRFYSLIKKGYVDVFRKYRISTGTRMVTGQNPPGHVPPGHLPQGHLPPGHLPPGH